MIKATVRLRVSRDQELRGPDIEERGAEAYTDFEAYATRQPKRPTPGSLSHAGGLLP